jgi:hypothetical protein
MQAILIKYLPATNTQGVRLKASARVGKLIEGRKYELECDQQARELAIRFAREMYMDGGFPITGFGMLPNGDYVATLGA